MSQDENTKYPFVAGVAYLLNMPLHSSEVEQRNRSLPPGIALNVEGSVMFVQDMQVGLTVTDDAFKARCLQRYAEATEGYQGLPELSVASALPMVFARWGQFRNMTLAQFRKAALGVEY